MEVRYTFRCFILCLIGCLFYSLNSHAQIQVTNIFDSGTGSLRAAINTANANSGADTIIFTFSGAAPFTIIPSSPLPVLNDNATIIDATIGYNLGDIRINGTNMIDGIVIQGDDCQIYGLSIYNCSEAGIEINGGRGTLIGDVNKSNFLHSNALEGIFLNNARDIGIKHNFLGTNHLENPSLGNQKGIVLLNSDTVYISENIIVQNNLSGVSINSTNNVEIKQNKIGISASGATMGNSGKAIYIASASSNIEIGGNSADANEIAYNNEEAVYITGGSYNCNISQNIIYCNFTGGSNVIFLDASSNQGMIAPVITFPTTSSITGTSTFGGATIEVFSHNNSNCTNAPCQGKTFLGSTIANGTGDWTLTGSFPSGISVTATATNNDNTSPFSTCLTVSGSPSTTCLSDSLALVDLYNTTNGVYWNTSWNLSQPMKMWQGVHLNAAGCVDTLILVNNNLSGTLPNLDLGSIEFLSLDSNALTGSIPNFDKMPNLKFLSLRNNNLNGWMPDFSAIYNLEVVALSDNSLSGTIPNLYSLYFLQHLDLRDNQFSGIPDFSSNYNLQTLNVSENQLTGVIPNFAAIALKTIKLNDNQLTGTIPDFSLPNLKNLHLQENDLDNVPDFSGLTSLEKLFLHNNDIDLLPQFSNLGNLEVIDVKNNQLTFDDIIQNLNNTSLASLVDFVYAPQDSVGIEKTVQLTSCDVHVIALDIDSNLSTNQYAWSKNGNWISTTSTDSLNFPSVKSIDDGIYTSAITNPNASDLTLFSRPVTIQVTLPTLTSCPNDIVTNTATDDCQQIVSWIEPTAIDLSGNSIAYTFRSHAPGSSFIRDTTKVKYVFCSPPDTVVCEFKVIVEDNQQPTFLYFPNDTTVNVAPNTCNRVVNWSPPTFSDNCPSPIISSDKPAGNLFPKGTTTVTYTLSDSSGNTKIRSFNVTVVDNINPVYAYFPNDTTVYANAACQNSITWSEPIGIDNCGAILSSTPNISNGTIFTKGTHTVTYTLYDSSGNSINQSFNITVLDTIKPIFTYFPNDTTVNTDANSCNAVVTWSTPIGSDDCGNTSLTSNQMLSTFPKGGTEIIYTLTDEDGNFIQDTLTITVVDNTPPSFTYFPNDTTVNTNANSCDAVVTWNMPIGNDDCGNTSLTSNQTLSTFPKGDTEIIYTLIDEAGNSIQDTLTITVEDTEDPTITYFPDDTTVYIASNCDIVVSWNSPIFYDNCDANPTSSSNISSGSTFQTGNTLIEYTFSDSDGNQTEREFTITVLDTIKPIINNCPIDTIFSCQSQVFWTVPTAIDNCTPAAQIGITNPNYNPGDNFPVGATDFQYVFTDTSGNSSICNFVVYVYPSLTSNTSSTMVSCTGGNDGTATVLPTNGLTPYTYAWNTSPTQPTATATNLTAGTYEVTITDANGCTSTESVTVNQPTAIFSSVTLNNDVSCNDANDGSATITTTGGTAPFTYLWDNGETTVTANSLNGGMRFVTITDANSCTKLDSVNVFEPAVMGSTLTIDSLSCNQLLGQPNDGKIVATALNGLAPYTYQWTNNVSTTQTADNLAVGTYSVTITDANGCTTTNTGTVYEPPILQVSVTIDQPTDCQGGATGVATVNAIGGNPSYSYQWSNSSTTTTVSNLTPGIHSVTVTDYGGCTIGSTFNMTQYQAIDKDSIRKTDITCTNSGGIPSNDGTGSIYISGGTLPYNYIWTNGNTTPTATNLDVGQHFVTVTDATGCTWIDSVMIAAPPAFVVNTNTFSDTCGLSQGQIQTSVTGGTFGYTYNWSTGQTSSNLNNISNGSYDLTVTDANSCTETANNIVVGNACDSCVLFNPISFITTSQFEYTCLGNGQAEVMLSVQGGKPEFDGLSDYTLTLTGSSVNGENGTYKDPSGIFSFIVNDGDNWNISITDDLNCSVISLDELFTESLNACSNFCDLYPVITTISNDTVVLLGDDAPLSISGGFTYNWFPSNSLSCNDCTNPIATPNETTTYTVISTDLNGCTATDTINVMITIVPDPNIFVKYNNGITGNQDGKNDNLVFENLHLYPKNELVIFNRYGSIVYQVSPYQNEWNGTFQGTPLPEGVYYFILRTDLNNTETLRGSVTIVK